MYKIIYFLTALSLTTFSLSAQPNETTFTVEVKSTVEAPADKISFRISIALTNNDPELLLKQHNETEQKLLALLEELNIPDSTIKFSLLNVRKAKTKKDELRLDSRQSVIFELTDFSKYFDVQIGLLTIGIQTFQPIFSTTHIEDAKKRGVKKALETAKKEAELYAENLNMKVSRVVEIESRVSDDFPYGGATYFQSGTSKKLLEIPQQISVQSSVRVKFALVSNE